MSEDQRYFSVENVSSFVSFHTGCVPTCDWACQSKPLDLHTKRVALARADQRQRHASRRLSLSRCRAGGSVVAVTAVAGWVWILTDRGDVTVQETFSALLKRIPNLPRPRACCANNELSCSLSCAYLTLDAIWCAPCCSPVSHCSKPELHACSEPPSCLHIDLAHAINSDLAFALRSLQGTSYLNMQLSNSKMHPSLCRMQQQHCALTARQRRVYQRTPQCMRLRPHPCAHLPDIRACGVRISARPRPRRNHRHISGALRWRSDCNRACHSGTAGARDAHGGGVGV